MELKLNELIIEQKGQLDILVDDVGGINHLAKMLNLPYATVKSWDDRGRISKAGAKLVEEHGTLGTYYKAIQLRPDM